MKNRLILVIFVILILIVGCQPQIEEATIFGCDNKIVLETLLEKGGVKKINIFCPPAEKTEIDPDIREYIRMDENDNETCYLGYEYINTGEILWEK